MFIAARRHGVARVGTATTTGLDVSAGTEETCILRPRRQRHRPRPERHLHRVALHARRRRRRRHLARRRRRRQLLGGSGNDHVDGNRGTDTAVLGSGNDRFQWDPGDGNDVVDGQAGNDTLDFNGSNVGEIIDVFRQRRRGRLTRNIANITMDFDNIEDVNIRALGGSDQILVDDLRGTDVDDVDVDLGAFGGGGDAAADTSRSPAPRAATGPMSGPRTAPSVVTGPSVQHAHHRLRADARHAGGQHARPATTTSGRPGRQGPDPDPRRPRNGRMTALRPLTTLAPLAAAVALFVAGCGGGSGVSKNDYVKSLNEAVASLQKSTASLGPEAATSGGAAVTRLEDGGQGDGRRRRELRQHHAARRRQARPRPDRRRSAQVRGHVPRARPTRRAPRTATSS